MLEALSSLVDAAYRVRGIDLSYSPKAGTGPIAARGLVGPAADDVGTTGDQVPGYEVKVLVDEFPARPEKGDVVTFEGLSCRVRYVELLRCGVQYALSVVPVRPVAPVPTGTALGILQPPLVAGAWVFP